MYYTLSQSYRAHSRRLYHWHRYDFICLPHAYWPLLQAMPMTVTQGLWSISFILLPFPCELPAVAFLFSFTFLPQRIMLSSFSRPIAPPVPHLLLTLISLALIKSFSFSFRLIPSPSSILCDHGYRLLLSPIRAKRDDPVLCNHQKEQTTTYRRYTNFSSRPILLQHLDIYEKLSPELIVKSSIFDIADN